MKIGIYSPYLDTIGGGERYMLTIAECLSTSHHVDIFWNDGSILERAKTRLNLSLQNVFVVPNIFNKPLVSKMLATAKYDCIFILSDGSVPVSFAKQTILHFQQPFQRVNGKKIINKLKFHKIPTIICNSHFTKRFIDQEYGVESSVIYPPVETSAFINKDSHKEKIILSVGRFHNVKKHHVMIEAFQKLNKKDWRLVIAGGLLEKDMNYFNTLAANITSTNILLKPNIPFMELSELYKSAKFYWHSTGFGELETEHPERFEHFGIAPVEAMSAGCIPLLYKGGGLVEIMEDFEELLWVSVDELIEKTYFYMKKPTVVKNIKNKLVQRSTLFDTATFGSRIQGLLQK